MATTDADPGPEAEGDPDADVPATPDARIDVTEVWPGRFAVEIETGAEGSSTTTKLDLDTEGLRALNERIDAALAGAH